ncbi:hypothetical protein [Streptomyces roseolus]
MAHGIGRLAKVVEIFVITRPRSTAFNITSGDRVVAPENVDAA